ncbi:MAG: Na+/H+ antiporter NhaA [Thermoleophilia bacterium]|nr:Na+/H+ antiporter NhaA [Thermoleophilia bacterium]
MCTTDREPAHYGWAEPPRYPQRVTDNPKGGRMPARLMPIRSVAAPIRSFVAWESAGGIALLGATIAALIWANVGGDSYEALWAIEITGVGLMDLVNDGLMTLFFLVIGLEVKRELAVGELSNRRAAATPLAAALGGMLLPAGIFLVVTAGTPAVAGWGIPMATDVAFALAVLTGLRSHIPASLWAFLLGVAVIDDIGAIIVIAVAYSGGVTAGWLLAAIGALIAMWGIRRVGVRSPIPPVVLGVATWAFTAASGVHATIAGVAIGLITPAVAVHGGGPSPIDRITRRLHPWSSFVILPLFALANAGIVFGVGAFAAEGAVVAALGVGLGLVLGKTLGLPLGALVAIRTGVGRMPTGVRWSQMIGIGLIAGIGFTVSLFITDLAFDNDPLSTAAKVGVLGGSVLAAVLGSAVLRAVSRRAPA